MKTVATTDMTEFSDIGNDIEKMIEGYYKKVDIVCRNLSDKQEGIENRISIRQAYLRELASVFPCVHDISYDLIDRLKIEYKDLTESGKLSFMKGEKELLCLHLANEITKRTADFSFDYFIHDRAFKPYRICYVKNHFSDIAYRIFDNALGGITSDYADSFELAAQSVFYENSTGCILPYESENGGVMTGIKAIVEKYDLNKSYVCMVDTGGQPTKFVLFTRGIWIDPDANKIEFTVNTDSFFDASDIISSCNLFGFSNGQMTSSSFSEDKRRTSTFIFTGDKSSMLTLMLYLSMEYERSNISGIYKELNGF